MSFTWRKLGLVYVADGQRAWQHSHAYCPTPLRLDDGRIRVLCAFLDPSMVGRVGYVDVAADDPTHVVLVSETAALDVGIPGTFDDKGVTPLSVVRTADGVLRLYYAGWEHGVSVRYFLFTGVAESDDEGESFSRVSQAPVLDRSDGELHIRSSVLVKPDGAGWRMWYAGGSEWVRTQNTALPRYALRHLRSMDGLTWPDHGEVVLAPQSDDEIGFSRPCVRRAGGEFQMWYSLRTLSQGYRLGYAVSEDGLRWQRRDREAGLTVSEEGWDSEMVCLSSMLETEYGTYLFYNGNNYGRTGFGVAVADPS